MSKRVHIAEGRGNLCRFGERALPSFWWGARLVMPCQRTGCYGVDRQWLSEQYGDGEIDDVALHNLMGWRACELHRLDDDVRIDTKGNR